MIREQEIMPKTSYRKCPALFSLIALASAHSTAATAQIFRPVEFSDRPGPTTISADGVEVTLQPNKDSDDQITVAAAIRIPGFQSIIVNEENATSAYYTRWVGIGKLAANDPAPSVLLQGFSGGAHCCATLQVITPSAGRLKVLTFDAIDGEGDTSFPSDLDGDGTVDFVRQDDSFRYQFASGAGSYSPPVVLNVYKGQLVDVSMEPAYRAVWDKFAVQTLAACADRSNDDRNGACAAYVAASARLGKFEAALVEADKLANQMPGIELPTDCTVDLVEYACPAGKEVKFYTFRSALVWFLQKNGYID
jgi:hypothetical protein